MLGQTGQRSQIKAVGGRTPAGCLAASGGLPVHMKIGRCNAYGLTRTAFSKWLRPGEQLDTPAIDFKALVRKLCTKTPHQMIKFDTRQISRETQADILQRNIRSNCVQAAIGKPGPGTHRSTAVRQRDRIVDPVAPDSEVGIVNLGIDPPLPGFEQIQIAAAKIATQINFRCQINRW